MDWGQTLSIARIQEEQNLANISISDLIVNNGPFQETFNVGRDAFREIDSIVDKPLTMVSYKTFQNDKGPGVSILASLRGDEELFYLTTHATNIVKTFQNPAVIDAFTQGLVDATITKRKSKTSDRMVYDFA